MKWRMKNKARVAGKSRIKRTSFVKLRSLWFILKCKSEGFLTKACHKQAYTFGKEYSVSVYWINDKWNMGPK